MRVSWIKSSKLILNEKLKSLDDLHPRFFCKWSSLSAKASMWLICIYDSQIIYCRLRYNTEEIITGFLCPDEEGLYPHPRNCGQFIQCAHRYPYLFDCPSPLHFNERLKVCDWPAAAGCSEGVSLLFGPLFGSVFHTMIPRLPQPSSCGGFSWLRLWKIACSCGAYLKRHLSNTSLPTPASGV